MPQDATSKHRAFKLHTIAVVHNCDVEATVAAFTGFSKRRSVLNVGVTGSLVKEIFLTKFKMKHYSHENFI